MIFNLYCVRDKYTGFLAPMPFMNDDAAKRDFAYTINNNPGVMNFSPADYDLIRVGKFDNHSGNVEAENTTQFICNGIEVFNEK